MEYYDSDFNKLKDWHCAMYTVTNKDVEICNIVYCFHCEDDRDGRFYLTHKEILKLAEIIKEKK